MAALTESYNVEEKDGVIHAGPMGVDIIYRGAMLMHNTSGFVVPAATASAGAYFAGIAEEEKDNSAGSAGDINCKYKREGVYLLTGAGLVQGDVGEQVYASDDQTVTKTSTTNPPVGRIVEFVSATQVWVLLDHNAAITV